MAFRSIITRHASSQTLVGSQIGTNVQRESWPNVARTEGIRPRESLSSGTQRSRWFPKAPPGPLEGLAYEPNYGLSAQQTVGGVEISAGCP